MNINSNISILICKVCTSHILRNTIVNGCYKLKVNLSETSFLKTFIRTKEVYSRLSHPVTNLSHWRVLWIHFWYYWNFSILELYWYLIFILSKSLNAVINRLKRHQSDIEIFYPLYFFSGKFILFTVSYRFNYTHYLLICCLLLF